MAGIYRGPRRIDDEKPVQYVEIKIQDLVIYVPKEYEYIKKSAMEKAKAQLILGGGSRESIEMAGRIAKQDLLMSLKTIRALQNKGEAEEWLKTAIRKLERDLKQ